MRAHTHAQRKIFSLNLLVTTGNFPPIQISFPRLSLNNYLKALSEWHMEKIKVNTGTH